MRVASVTEQWKTIRGAGSRHVIFGAFCFQSMKKLAVHVLRTNRHSGCAGPVVPHLISGGFA
jgi:hypothetical protein